MQLSAVLKLVIPLALVVTALLGREYLAGLSSEMLVLVNSMPYLMGGAVILVSCLFGRLRPLLAALGIMVCYWLIRSELQVALSEPRAAGVYLGLSVCLPVLLLYLFLVPDRGIWNPRSLLTTALFFGIALLLFATPLWLPVLSEPVAAWFVAKPSDGYVMSYGATIAVIVSLLLGLLVVFQRDQHIDAALVAVLLGLYVALAQLHLPFVSVAMCTAAGLSLVLGVLQSSYFMAYRDDLTGLKGRRALNERLAGLGKHYAIAMLDVDHFKRFNDKHGHDVGDQVLRLVASRIKGVKGGQSYRYGGEEFCIVFPRSSVDECLPALDDLRNAIGDYQMSLRDRNLRPNKKEEGSRKRGASKVGNDSVGVTVSIGVAERSDALPDTTAVIKTADNNLYRAKRTGRDRVVG
ncbi:MAG: GGDEF domain-containing protein [Halioglobus sp.]